jgi:sugar lactone lactonase YvrE
MISVPWIVRTFPEPTCKRVFTCLRKLGRLTVPCLVVALMVCVTWKSAAAQTRVPSSTILVVSSGGSAATTVASGSMVTLTASVSSGSTALTTGQVNFCDASANYCTDIHLLGTAQLTHAGTAVLRLRPGIGNHSYKAVFSGTKSYSGSFSSAAALSVTGLYSTATSITQSGSIGDYTLAASVSAYAKNASGPTGLVSFLDTTNNNAVLATANLGAAVLAPSLVNVSNPKTGNSPGGIVAGDFNGDGNLDLAVAVTQPNQSVSIVLGDGRGNFTEVTTSPITASGTPVLVQDFNGDGIPDLVLSNTTSNSITILLGNGDGTFTETPTSPFSTNYGSYPIVAGDFNGEGIADLAAAGGYYLIVMLGNGDGTFTNMPTNTSISQAFFSSMVVGDFNGDGNTDIGTLNFSSQSISLLLGNGDGTFRQMPPVAISPTSAGSSTTMAAGDFNGDGKLDLAAPIYGGNGSTTILLGNGDGTFQTAPAGPVAVSAWPNRVAVGDFNGDGIADLVVGTTLNILLGKGDGTFSQMLTSATQLPCCSNLVLGDFNGDGITDVISSDSYNGSAQVLLTQLNQATATVTAISPTGPGPHQVIASYSGDSMFTPSVSGTTALSVQMATPTISPGPTTYKSAQTISITDATPGATIYYYANGVVSTVGFVPYTGPITLSTAGSEQIQAYATEAGYTNSSTMNWSYNIDLPPAPAPVISLPTGSYSATQTVTISDAASGATIYYTTNGRIPTTKSAVYTGAITIPISGTVAAIAIASGYGPSSVASATYYISSSLSSYIYTVAGNYNDGYSGDGGPATVASINSPWGTLVDGAGNIYIADSVNNVVRRVDANTSIITTIAGTGISGYSGDSGPATSAQLWGPTCLAIDGGGNLYICDSYNHVVRKVAASTGIITTYAGSISSTALGDGGPATSAQLSTPTGIVIDASGNLYISTFGQRVRKVNSSTGTITTIAGTGTSGYTGDNGPAISATLALPSGLGIDNAGNIYIADTQNQVIRKVTATTGVITTIAGMQNRPLGVSYGGDGGPAINAELNYPDSVVVDGAGNIYIAETGNNVVREVTASNGIIQTIVGTSPLCSAVSGDGEPANNSAVCIPRDLTLDSLGNLYIAESGANRIRKVTAAMQPPATATPAPVFNAPAGTYSTPQTVSITDAVPGAEIYVTFDGSTPSTAQVAAYREPIDVNGSVTIRAVAVAPGYLPSAPVTATYTVTTPPPAVITTIAGSGSSGTGGAGGLATNTILGNLNGVAVDAGGNVYAADPANCVVWMVSASTGKINVAAGTLGSCGNAGNGGLATSALLHGPSHVALDNAGNLYIADSLNKQIRRVAVQTGIISLYAGTGIGSSFLGDGGPAISAYLLNPTGVAVDKMGNLYIADEYNNRIRMVSANTGIITSVVGNTCCATLGDGGPATTAYVSYPSDVAVDGSGNLYIADRGNGRVRRVAANTGVITTVAGNGDPGTSGDGGLATAAEVFPMGLALDGVGNLYISGAPGSIRMVAANSGIITSVAGIGYCGFSGDGGSATLAQLCISMGLALDQSGSLYIADTYNNRIRKVAFGAQAATPGFSLAAGTFTGTQALTISDTTANVTIYYTIDGSTPTKNSSVYSGPITISSTETVNAIAVAAGYTNSAVASAAYTINSPTTPTITWPTPAAIVYGSPLSNAQLDATTTIAGSFAYSPAAGTVLTSGTQTLSAVFTPTDTTSYTNATASVVLTVSKATPTAVTVAASANPLFVSNAVMFTASVASSAGAPTGTLNFYDGSVLIGQGTLNGGTASYTTSALAAGTHAITIVYSGDGNFAPVASAALAEVVEDFTFAAPSGGAATASVSPGGQATYTLAVTPASGNPSAGAITFAVTGLPAGATAVFSPSSLPANSTVTNVTLTVNLSSSAAMRPEQRPFGGGVLPVALCVLLLPVIGRLRQGSGRLICLAIAGVGLMAGLSGCSAGSSSSSSSSPTSTPQTYALTVTATSGSLSHSIALSLTVK